jgi:hypothetical protein
MWNCSQHLDDGNRDSPSETLDTNSIFMQLCNQENITANSLPWKLQALACLRVTIPLVAGSSRNEKESGLRDQKSWSIAECAQIFADSCRNLKNQYEV